MSARLIIALSALMVTTMALAQPRPLVPVDQEVSREEVLRLVDAKRPGLEPFAAAMQANDLPRAQGLLVQHFATRSKPVIPPAQAPGISEGNSMCVLGKTSPEQADKWLKHVFTIANNDLGKSETYDLGPDIPWLKNPSPALSWILYLNQLNHLNALAGLYRENRDETLATEVGESVLRWSRQVPAWYGYTTKGEITPSGMEVRNRLCNLLVAYDALRASPSLTPDMHLAFWKVFIACARELMKYEGVSYPGLIYASVMLPEFTESKTWLKSGEENLRFCLVSRTSPEGAWDTQSISYQTVPVPWSLRCLEFLQANPESGDFMAMAEMVRTQIGKLLGLMLRIAMPNGALPNVGDTYGRPDWSDGHTRQLLVSFIHSQMTPEQQAKLNAIKDTVERLQAALALADGAPPPASQTFPGSGYTVMRSGWKADQARYLYFDLTPQGMGHAHNDAGHFDLYGYGKPLLADTGDYFLGWGYRGALHNTIEIDGRDQARGAAKAPMVPCDWASCEGFDLVEGAHGAYEDLGVRHRRKIVFVKGGEVLPDYFVLSDWVGGQGSHLSEQFFHFAGPTQMQAATAELDPQTLAARSTNEGVANVQIIPASTDGLKAQFVAAQDTDMKPDDKYERAAMLGWMVTGGTFQRVKAPVVAYRREGAMPQAYCDVLFPVPAHATAEVKVTALPVTANGQPVPAHEATGLQVDWKLTRPNYDEAQLQPNLGPNLALGKPGFAEINQGDIARTTNLLTDGDPSPEVIGGAVSSSPYTPGVLLTGRFGVDFGQETEVNTVVLHQGTWNGSQILYPAGKLSLQTWDGQAWRDVADQQTTWRDGAISQTTFAPVRTTRLSVAVERPDGGRLALREFEAYRVPEAELQRVAAMARETVTQQGRDLLLLADHTMGWNFGSYRMDGRLAIIREMSGQPTRVSLYRAEELRWPGGRINTMTQLPWWVTVELQETKAVVSAPDQSPIMIEVNGQRLPAVDKAGQALPALREDEARPKISNLRAQFELAQPGFAAAQPSALVTFTTSEPTRAEVSFGDHSGGRSVRADAFATEHAIRLHFLRPDFREQMLQVCVADRSGNYIGEQITLKGAP